MKKFSHLIVYIVTGIFSLIFFLYMLFPYESLKESISLKLSEQLGVTVSMDSLGIKFPVGFGGYGIKINVPNGKALEIKSADVRLSLLSLFTGKLGVWMNIWDKKDGYFSVYTGFGFFSILSGGLPSVLEVSCKDFMFGPLVNFTLSQYASSPEASPLLKPLLEGLDVEGKLSSDIALNLNNKDFTQSKGQISIGISNFKISSLNNALPIANQVFSKANIQGKIDSGVFSLGQNVGFVSQDISIAMNGKATLKPDVMKSILDMVIDVELAKAINDQVGIILYGITQKESNGQLKVSIVGPLSPAPNITFE